MQKVASILKISTSTVGIVVKKAGKSRSKSEAARGSRNARWNEGRSQVKGYVRCLCPGHPRRDSNGYVLEHILVAEGMLERELLPGEEVHHKDRNRANNAPENLRVMVGREHIKLHIKEGDIHEGQQARQTWFSKQGAHHAEEKQYWEDEEERQKFLKKGKEGDHG